ncbi:MAG: aminotransferase class III-fold pyridoxal phosphate-dependent enzyme [Eubacteriales bacterium]
MEHCGITRWDDPDAINEQLKRLTSEPIYEVSGDYYQNEVLTYFNDKCAHSRAVYEEAKEYIPGGVQHNLAFNQPFPICVTKASGAYMTDADGNRYIDFLQAGGPTILGSNNEAVRKAAMGLIEECGPVTGLLHEAELLIAKEIHRHMPAVEMFRMLGSGIRGRNGLLRIARIATGKKRIIKIGGAYHGWSDQMVYGAEDPRQPRAAGEPRHPRADAMRSRTKCARTILACWRQCCASTALRAARRRSSLNLSAPRAARVRLRWTITRACVRCGDKYGALLIFDEVVTGFALASAARRIA